MNIIYYILPQEASTHKRVFTTTNGHLSLQILRTEEQSSARSPF